MNFVVYQDMYDISRTNLLVWILRQGWVVEDLCGEGFKTPHGIRGWEIRAKRPRERQKTVCEVHCITRVPALDRHSETMGVRAAACIVLLPVRFCYVIAKKQSAHHLRASADTVATSPPAQSPRSNTCGALEAGHPIKSLRPDSSTGGLMPEMKLYH